MYKIAFFTLTLGACLAQSPAPIGYQSARPTTRFGAAGFRADVASLEGGYSSGSQQYGGRSHSSTGSRYGGSASEEPAKYEFNYDVNDQEYAIDLRHREQRDGDNTRGTYYVLLPDGRKQIVQYTADPDGYHPVVSYEETASGRSGNNGYQGRQSSYPSTRRNGGYQSASRSTQYTGY